MPLCVQVVKSYSNTASKNLEGVELRVLRDNIVCLKIFCERNFRQRRAKCVSGNLALCLLAQLIFEQSIERDLSGHL